MGFNTSNNTGKLFNVRYSAFLGGLYLLTNESQAAIKAVKDGLGEEAVKTGFTGSQGSGASAQALAKLKEQGIAIGGNLKGRLSGVRLVDRDVNGQKMSYVSVTVSDESGEKTNLSVELTQQGAQMMVRKLFNAAPDQQTAISVFATYAKKEGSERAYANHVASVKQSDAEIKGVDPLEVLKPTVDAAMQKLTDAGVPADDTKTRSNRRSQITLEYHLDLLKQTQENFKAFYDKTGLPVPADDDGAAGPSE